MRTRVSDFNLSSFLIRYGSAILFVGLATLLTLIIWTFIRAFASPLFFLAIIMTAWFSGLRAGILATFLSGAAINYLFVNPVFQVSGHTDDLLRLMIFTLEGGAFCWLITWRLKAAEEIKNSREQLRALSLRQQTLIENERKRMALEIHDELGQILTGLKMEIHLLNGKITQNDNSPENASELNGKIKEILQSIDGSIATVRRISTYLRPPVLDDLGLVAAIEWQALEFQRRTGIPCNLKTNLENPELSSEFSTSVFRIFQETLTNITRHAKASSVAVRLERINQKLILRVEDDGDGIRLARSSGEHSLGILGMQERARLINGELKVFNGERGGTTVELIAPF